MPMAMPMAAKAKASCRADVVVGAPGTLGSHPCMHECAVEWSTPDGTGVFCGGCAVRPYRLPFSLRPFSCPLAALPIRTRKVLPRPQREKDEAFAGGLP